MEVKKRSLLEGCNWGNHKKETWENSNFVGIQIPAYYINITVKPWLSGPRLLGLASLVTLSKNIFIHIFDYPFLTFNYPDFLLSGLFYYWDVTILVSG